MTAPAQSGGHDTTDAIVSATTIHDLGYRRYHGERVSESGAWSALVSQSLRTMFGLGRPAKAKAVPVLVIVMSMLPSLAVLVGASASNGQQPVQYAALIGPQLLLVVLFVAAQVPEVLSRDQQHQLLPLLFTRDVSRASYALSRYVAIFSAVLVVALAPLLLLYLGEIGIAKDPAATFRIMGTRIGPVLAQGSLTAFALSGVGVALAAWTSRRAYAAAAIFGTILLLAALATGLDDLAGVSRRTAELLDPVRALRTMAFLFFGETNRGMETNPPASLGVYIALMLTWGGAGVLVLYTRMRKVRA